LKLGPKPTTQRVKKIAKKTPSDAGGGQFLQDKQIDEVTLLDHAEVSSVLLAPNGSLLRRENILAPHIDYFTQKRKLVVPVPGRMLLEDHTRKSNANAPGATPQGQGVTAFQWDRNFTFDQLAEVATFDSPVTIVHKADGPDAKPVRVIADHVVAHFQPGSSPAQPAGAPADGTDPAATPLKLKDVTASGNVRIYSETKTGQVEIDCNQADYDASNDILICRGQEGVPVTVSDPTNGGGGTFGEVWFNADTGQIIRMIDFNGHNR